MKFMVLVKANEESEAGQMPDTQMLTDMNAFNERLVKSGMMLAGEGLHPSSRGKRLQFAAGGKPTVVDGPFAETKELLAGFWLIEADSLDALVEVFQDCPMQAGAQLELRKVFEADDFGDALTPELREAEQRMRAQGAAQ